MSAMRLYLGHPASLRKGCFTGTLSQFHFTGKRAKYLIYEHDPEKWEPVFR